MKTTVDIPDALYRQAKIRAAEEGTTLRALLVNSLAESLVRQASNAETLPRRQRFEVDERGWPVLKRAPGDTTVITDEMVNRLRELEGV
ncbi:MAG: antitoxin [Acidobacteria bacterium]|nr:antitoxin [Acidobacteriota bacterium]MYH28230.1 antitoxin [Acidobacteriota bacterium]